MLEAFRSARSIRSESIASPNVQSNSDKTAYSNQLRYILRGLAEEQQMFESCEIWKTPLDIQQHPVFARGTVLPTLPGFIQVLSTSLNIYGLEKITFQTILKALAAQASVPSGLMMLGSAGAIYSVYKGVTILLQHHMVILKTNKTKVFLEFHAEGLSILEGEAVKIPPYSHKDCVRIQVARKVVSPLKVLEELELRRKRSYNILLWNCQHFARDVFTLFGEPRGVIPTEQNIDSVATRLKDLFFEKSLSGLPNMTAKNTGMIVGKLKWLHPSSIKKILLELDAKRALEIPLRKIVTDKLIASL